MSTPPRIRLRQRAPNPVPSFSGRGADEAALVAMLDRCPVALVSGPPGIGKTQLVLHAMRGPLEAHRETTLFVEVREDEALGQLVRALLTTLAETLGRTLDEDLLTETDEVLVDAAVDLAEQGPFWVVLDGVDHARDGGSLLATAAGYAHRSRWIATTRALPDPRLATCCIELGPMDVATLMGIGRLHAPRADAVTLERAALGSSGSPWLFTQLLDTSTGDLGSARARLRGQVSDAALELLRVLAAVRFTLPTSVLAQVLALPSPDELDTLERRGLVVRDALSMKVRDTVTALFFGDRPSLSNDVRRALATGLADGEPEAKLDALALLGESDDVARMRELLERDGDGLLRAGLAPRLFRVLHARRDEALARWRVRCAAELGNPTALAGVASDHPRELDELGSPDDQLAWAHTKYAHGDLTAAASLAAAVGRTAGSSSATKLRASILEARCARHRGELVALAPHSGDPELDLERDALALVSSIERGAREHERTIVDLAARAADHPEAGLDVSDALITLERLDEASSSLSRALLTPRGSDTAHLTARRGRLLAARLALVSGSLEAAEVSLAAVRPFARRSSLLRGSLLALDVERRLVLGAFVGLEEDLAIARRECGDGDHRSAARLGSLRARLSIAHGAGEEGTGVWSLALRARRDPMSLPSSIATASREDASTAAIARALCAIGRGAWSEALEQATAALDAGRAGLAVQAAEAHAVLCDAVLAAGRADAHAYGERFLAQARALASPRFVAEAELCLALSRPDPARFERLAGALDVSPIAARRARAVLGVPAPLDAVDRAVIERARTALRLIPSTEPWIPGWGLSPDEPSVWLEDGRTVSLAARPLLWSLLSALAARTEATKEELVLRVWSEREYHPLRHDARLQMSIRKLRELIEDDVSAPTRLLTVEGGYRLGGCVRRHIPRGPTAP